MRRYLVYLFLLASSVFLCFLVYSSSLIPINLLGGTSSTAFPPVALSVDRQHRYSFLTVNKLHVAETHIINYNLSGRIFSSNVTNISGKILTSFLHSFHKEVEENAKAMFYFRQGDNRKIYTTTIGATWVGTDVDIVIRIWLFQEGPEKKKNSLFYQNSYLYMQRFNSSLQPVTHPQLIGIPSSIMFTSRISGPEDPRIFYVGENGYIMYSMLLDMKGGRTIGIFLWDIKRSVVLHPEIQNHSLAKQEKNWVPFTVKGVLHFIYSMDPLRVLKCDERAKCHFVFEGEPGSMKAHAEPLRGGTPFVEYQWPYYVSLAHSTFRPDGGIAEINAHFVLMRVDQWRIVYVSDKVNVDYNILKTSWHPGWTFTSYIYPTGILMESHDVINVAVNVGDDTSCVFRLKGQKTIFDNVIKFDSKSKNVKLPSGTIQKYVLDIAKREIKQRTKIFAKS